MSSDLTQTPPVSVPPARSGLLSRALLLRFVSVVGSSIGFYLPFVAGRLGDRHGQACLLAPGLLLASIGMACLAATGMPSAVIGGALVFGIGFGLLQNATLVLMYSRAPAGGEGAVSAIWNASYDLGMAAGALCAGLVVAAIGCPTTVLLTAGLMLPAFIVLRRDNSSRRCPTTPGGEPCAP